MVLVGSGSSCDLFRDGQTLAPFPTSARVGSCSGAWFHLRDGGEGQAAAGLDGARQSLPWGWPEWDPSLKGTAPQTCAGSPLAGSAGRPPIQPHQPELAQACHALSASPGPPHHPPSLHAQRESLMRACQRPTTPPSRFPTNFHLPSCPSRASTASPSHGLRYTARRASHHATSRPTHSSGTRPCSVFV